MKTSIKWLSVLVTTIALVASYLGLYTSTAQAVDYPSTTINPLAVDLDFNSKKISNIGDVITKGPWTDVRAYGAKGDGVTNDTAAIQAAIEAARGVGGAGSIGVGGIVFFPSGTYNVTSLTMRPWVTLKGEWCGLDGEGSRILGTDVNQDVIVIPSETGGRNRFRFEGLAIAGGRRCIASYNKNHLIHITDCYLVGAAEANLYFEGSTEELYVTNTYFQNGQYGFYHARVADQWNDNYIDRSSFKNCIFTGMSVNAVRLDVVNANSLTFINCTSMSIQQSAFRADGNGLQNLTFIGWTSEASGLAGGDPRNTTGSITALSNTLTVADATGYAINDIATVQGAGDNGIDLSQRITGINGLVLTLEYPAGTTVTNARVTRAIYDDFSFGSGANNGGADHTFISCQLAGSVSNRYSVNMSNIAGQFTFIDVQTADQKPIYDPLGYACVIGGRTLHRTPSSPVGDSFRVSSFSNSNVPGSNFEAGPRTKIFSSRGGNLLFGLRDTNDDGTGTYGIVEVRKRDANRTRVFSIDNAGAVAMSSTLTIGNGTAITKHLSATTTWDPPSINNGAATSTTVTVTGAAVGDTVAVGFSTAVPGRALLVGAVTAIDTVTVTLANHTGGAINLASGTLRADVWRH